MQSKWPSSTPPQGGNLDAIKLRWCGRRVQGLHDDFRATLQQQLNSGSAGRALRVMADFGVHVTCATRT